MSRFVSDDDIKYKIVVNHEEQYSIWPADLASPDGWVDFKYTGTRQECIAYIDKAWKDMTPKSLRIEHGKI